MFGKVIIDNEGVHAVIHEPFAHRGTSEWGQILARRGIGRGGSDDNGVRHSAGFFKYVDEPSNARLFLPNRNIYAIERAIVLIPSGFRCLVQASLANDGVDANRRLAGRTVSNDQFAL